MRGRKANNDPLQTFLFGIFIGATMLLISSELSLRKYDTYDARYVRGTPGNSAQRTIPELKRNDLIYNKARNTVPIVIKEYNLIFFLQAKVASSEWLRFFMRLENKAEWCAEFVYEHLQDTMTLLSDYNLNEAQSMMTDVKWKKVMFVRHPKPRILSAFLNRFVAEKELFKQHACKNYATLGSRNVTECTDAVDREDFSFFLKEITTVNRDNVHWRTISSTVDEKWWPWIDEIYDMENISENAKTFLQSIKSNIDGVSAWDRIGKTGWSENVRDCNPHGDSAFMEKKDIHHKTDANTKLRRYYTPDLERFVEERYADDLNNPYFHFSPIQLYVNA